MGEPGTLTERDVNRLFDELPDLLEREEDGNPIVSKMPDGTYWEYDEGLEATVEVAPDRRRYVVKYQKGRGLVRIKDLSFSAA
jgi:hypothetical protein